MSDGGAFFGPQGVRALKAETVTMWVGFAALLAAATIALALSQAWGWAALISAGIVGVLAVLVHANLRRHR